MLTGLLVFVLIPLALSLVVIRRYQRRFRLLAAALGSGRLSMTKPGLAGGPPWPTPRRNTTWKKRTRRFNHHKGKK